MSFSLLDDAWIPILRADGTRHTIRPWEITDAHDANPITAFAASRADFAGTHAQFLIALLQTACAPDTEQQWREWYTTPPSTDELHKRFAAYRDMFRLDGAYPRCMQDATVADAESKPIAALLIEAPGDNTIKNNVDHFIKRGFVEGLCPACAGSALLTLQINAPSGGQGHRTSLRGGGPLTTLLVDETLWKSLWLNVLPTEGFNSSSGADATKTEPSAIFPWMGPIRGDRPTTPEDTHPLHVYWAMPRRIHLDTETATYGTCSICGAVSEQLMASYKTKNYGFDYKNGWRHPLSPHTKNKDGEYLPEHAQPGGVRYKHWLGFVQIAENKQQAHVVHYFLHTRQARLLRRDIDATFRLFAFGYDMDNMKARCWYEGTMPLILVEQAYEKDYQDAAQQAITAASKATEFLRMALRSALRTNAADVQYDASIIVAAETQWWSDTAPGFYAFLHAVRDALLAGIPLNAAKEQWWKHLQQHTIAVFNSIVLSSPIEHSNPKRVAKAYNSLLGHIRYYNTFREILDLPLPEGTKGKDSAKAKKKKTKEA